MADLPTYERRIAPEGQPQFDNNLGGTGFYARLRDTFSRLAGKVGQMADRAAAGEGERAGMMAGLDPEFRPGRRDTIYGQAYDRAGTRTWLDSRENELREQMDTLSIQFEADPARLADAIGQLEAKTAKDLEDADFPEANTAFAGLFSRARTTHVREAIRAKTAKDEAQFLAAANEAVDRRANAVGRASYGGGLDEENQKVVAGEIEAVRRTVEAGIEAGIYTPEQGRKIVAAVEKEGVFGTIKGTFDRLPTIEEKKKYLAQVQDEYRKGTDFIDVLSLEDFERLQNDMEAGIGSAESRRNGALTGIDRSASSIEERAGDGFAPPLSEIATLRATAEATGDPAAIARVDQAEQMVRIGEMLVRKSPLEIEVIRRQTVLDMEKNGASARSVDVLKAIDSVKGKMKTALDSDPYAWGARSGAIKPVPALTLQGAAMNPTFQDRLAARDIMRARYGRSVPFFTAQEKESIAYIARNGGQPALDLAQGMIGALGKSAPDVIAEISEDAPVLANLAGLMQSGSGMAVAQDAMAAMSARKSPETKPLSISEAQEQLAARDFFGGAYLADGKAEGAVRATAKLAFEKRARDRGLTGDLQNDAEARELYEQALDAAAGASMRNGVKHGGVDEVNGVKIVIPPDVAAGEIEDRLNRITDLSMLPPIGSANGVPVRAGQVQGATLVMVGNGRYRAALGDPRSADPRYLLTPEGTFWTVTVDDLRRAAPDLEPVLLEYDALGNPVQ